MRLLAFAFVLLATPAWAQQQPDPQIFVYQQLLTDANARLAQTVARYEQMVAGLKKQIADLQAKYEPKKPDARK